eukprot:1205516-Amphidinium_carterae.1
MWAGQRTQDRSHKPASSAPPDLQSSRQSVQIKPCQLLITTTLSHSVFSAPLTHLTAAFHSHLLLHDTSPAPQPYTHHCQFGCVSSVISFASSHAAVLAKFAPTLEV